MIQILQEPLSLPCGATLSNRVAKAAMTEALADIQGTPTPELERLYGLWSAGGAALLISGNIQVDRAHLERPGNVVIEGDDVGEFQRTALRQWTSAATRAGNHFWAQLNHPGRQTQKVVIAHPKAPSAVPLDMPGGLFGRPIPLSLDEIEELVDRFAKTAATCRSVGFTGVQIHAAHGYLLSQFLNPRANQRIDTYGGCLENRARFLLQVVKATRQAVGGDFPIAVKLNSADFQHGGFAFEDSLRVATWLSEAGIDLLEISGGNYEQPRLLGLEGVDGKEEEVAASTAAREAYFVDFAKAMQAHVDVPLMVTGGFRSRAVMEYALESGAAQVIGIGRPMCYLPSAPRRLFDGMPALPTKEKELRLVPRWLSFSKRVRAIRTVDGLAMQFWFYRQLFSLAETGEPDFTVTPFGAMLREMRRESSLLAGRSAEKRHRSSWT